jgi:hypothetical protein
MSEINHQAVEATGSIQITLQEHCTVYPKTRSIPAVLWMIAAKKGCPVVESIEPKPHPDFKYRVILDHEEKVIIEWKKIEQ